MKKIKFAFMASALALALTVGNVEAKSIENASPESIEVATKKGKKNKSSKQLKKNARKHKQMANLNREQARLQQLQEKVNKQNQHLQKKERKLQKNIK